MRMAAAVLVVELRLGHRVVHVDGREEELALPRHVDQAVHTRRGLLGDALDRVGDGGPATLVLGQALRQCRQDDLELLRVGRRRVGHGARLLELDTLVHEKRGVAAVVEDHVGATLAGPQQGLEGAPPVLLQGLALPGEHRDALGIVDRAVRTDSHGGGGVILSGEDVAAGPAHPRAERRQRLDQHGRLDRHVQRAGDTGPGERLGRSELVPHGHQSGHLVLGQFDLLASERGQGEIGHLVGEG
jgi:hypothetical protein